MPRTHKHYVAPIDEEAIGRRLRQSRLRRGMTQVELAQETGITQSAVSDYEKGEARMHAALVAAFAKALRVPTDQLLGFESPRENGQIKDRRFLRRLERIDQLSKRDRQSLLNTIDAYLAKIS